MGERLGKLLALDLLLVYQEALKEPLVQQPPFLRSCQQVGPLYVVRQFQRLVERGQHAFVLNTQMLDAFGQSDPLSLNALLLGGEQGFADLIGVVGGQ